LKSRYDPYATLLPCGGEGITNPAFIRITLDRFHGDVNIRSVQWQSALYR